MPYYLNPPVAPPTGTGTEPLNTWWRAANPPPAAAGLNDPKNERNLTRFNPFPAVDHALTAADACPSVPRAPQAKPAAGWPVVIFQHGITRDRSDACAVADAAAAAGFVIAASTCRCTASCRTIRCTRCRPPIRRMPLYQACQMGEQTFNLDYVNNTTTAPRDRMASSIPPGTHFINLSYPLASRDNLRQGARTCSR